MKNKYIDEIVTAAKKHASERVLKDRDALLAKVDDSECTTGFEFTNKQLKELRIKEQSYYKTYLLNILKPISASMQTIINSGVMPQLKDLAFNIQPDFEFPNYTEKMAFKCHRNEVIAEVFDLPFKIIEIVKELEKTE